MPSFSLSGRLTKANIRPISMPNIGPPIIGKYRPSMYAGTVRTAHRASPSKIFLFVALTGINDI